ncbi:MAG: cysteine desulfurase family protein [Bacilli bacterium]|jgi:cysteine desulfurase|nr:cysteine desulfurase family protein [Bacilli bacterium]
MIYLDYSATTPVSYDVLESYNKATRDYIGNANSIHSLGVKSKALLNSATKQIAELLNIKESEVIYTSGATESNNMALIGAMLQYKNRGNHLIVSKLEHPSIYAICNYLETLGFQVSYVNNDTDGLIDFEDLKKKIRPETILVSICGVNSETGVRQPLKTIRQIIKKENPNTIFHSDLTQAFGKVSINLFDVDMASMSGHKIFGPKGIGLLYKNSKVSLIPIIHGSTRYNNIRPGTPPLPLIVALSKAMRLALNDLDRKEAFVKRLNDKIVHDISHYKDIKINQTKYSIPHILNISLMNIKPESFVHAMEEHEVYISTNTACSSGELSTSVMAIYNDKARATTTIRISLSSITTLDDVNKFLTFFHGEYQKFIKLKMK